MLTEPIVIILLSAISGIVWLVRLEGKVSHNAKLTDECQKDVDNLRVKVETIDSSIVKELTEIKVTLAKIDGYISSIKENLNK